MLPGWALCRRQLRLLHFEPAMEDAYRAHQDSRSQWICTIWGIVIGALVLAGGITTVVLFGWGGSSWVVFLSDFLMFMLCLCAAFGPRFVPVLRPYSSHIFISVGVILMGWTGWMSHSISRGLVAYTKYGDELSDVWALIGTTSPKARHQLEAHVARECSERIMFIYILFDYFALDLLRMAGHLQGAAACCLALPVTFAVAYCSSSVLSNSSLAPLIAAAIISPCVFVTTIYLSMLQRGQFQSDNCLRLKMEEEAVRLEEARRDEERRREASQQADSTLYHILKNIMADACGCVDLFLDGAPSPADPSLLQAVACLSRGIQWCKQRQVMVQITAGGYTPMCVPVNLHHFGQSLTQGRNVSGDFPPDDEVVLLDPTVCAIVLDNAIANAVRHGDPQDPQVRLAIRIAPRVPGAAPQLRRVVFTVTNRIHPTRPPITRALVDQILAGDRSVCKSSTALSDGVGLKHTYMAAETHGMHLTLEQVGDVVCLEASLDALPADEFTRQPTETICEKGRAFPEGIRIFCLEDSEVSRRILLHGLTTHTSAADVQVFGKDAEDVLRFQEAALNEADIIILDQHLDYGDVQYTGSDVLRSLLGRGYHGFVCIRSADASHEDELEYNRAGAHCVIGKDVRIQETAETLQARYSRWLHRNSSPALLAPGSMQQRLASASHSPAQQPGSPQSAQLGRYATAVELLLEHNTGSQSSGSAETAPLSPTSLIALRQPPAGLIGAVRPDLALRMDSPLHVRSISPLLSDSAQRFPMVMF
eukprot:EG_transcript_1055